VLKKTFDALDENRCSVAPSQNRDNALGIEGRLRFGKSFIKVSCCKLYGLKRKNRPRRFKVSE